MGGLVPCSLPSLPSLSRSLARPPARCVAPRISSSLPPSSSPRSPYLTYSTAGWNANIGKRVTNNEVGPAGDPDGEKKGGKNCSGHNLIRGDAGIFLAESLTGHIFATCHSFKSQMLIYWCGSIPRRRIFIFACEPVLRVFLKSRMCTHHVRTTAPPPPNAPAAG